MINIDMWYGDDLKEVDKIDIAFYDLDCVYRGNIYINGKIVGDYASNDSLKLEKSFPQLTFNWN